MLLTASFRDALAEIFIGVALLLVGFGTAWFAGRHFTRTPEFYQTEFGPAVMVALGRGFVNPVAVGGSPLDDFLRRRRSALAPEQVDNPPVNEPSPFQHGMRYLLTAVGYCWKLTGIAWQGVWWIAAALYALGVLACYAIFRLGVPRLLAAAGATFMCLSPVHLEQMPSLRDYSKVPFILGAIPFIVAVGLRPLSRARLLLASAACGAITGIGIGFRMDVGVVVPLFLAALVLFRGRRPWDALGEKARSAAIFLMALAITSAPVVSRIWGGRSNPYHAILLGYTEPYQATLRVRPSVYGVGLIYSDRYVQEAVSHYSERLTGQRATYSSDAYNAASSTYWLHIIRHFPADVLTRTLAAANAILNLPFQNHAPDFLDTPLPGERLLNIGLAQLRRLDGFGMVCGATLIMAGGIIGARHGMFIAAQMLALFWLSALEFERRHVFHLEFISVLALLVIASAAWRWLLAPARWREQLRRVPRGGFALAVAAGAVVAPVPALRAYQTAHLRGLFHQYIQTPRTAMLLECSDVGDGTGVVRWPAKAGYYAAEFDWPSDPAPLAIRVRYRAQSPPDPSSIMTITARPGINRMFFSIYDAPGAFEFEGLEIPIGLKSHLRGVYGVRPPDRGALPLDLKLSSDWQRELLYETLQLERNQHSHDLRFLDALPAPARVAWVGRLASPTLIPHAGMVDRAYDQGVVVHDGRIDVDARAEKRSSPLFELKPVVLNERSALLAHGRLESGGVALGLMREQRWSTRVSVTEPGSFVAILEVTEPGVYVPTVVNEAPKDGWRNRLALFRFGVITAQ